MAWIKQSDSFDADEINSPIIGIAAKMNTQHDSGFHQHQKGQFLFTQSGAIQITLKQSLSILPPTRVAWIPPQVVHRAQMYEAVGYRSIYLDTQYCAGLSTESEIIEVSPLLREIFERIALAEFNTDWLLPAFQHLIAVFFDELTIAYREPTLLPLPTDRRLRRLNLGQLPGQLQEVAQLCGASEKTITRLFRKETGLSYQQWRQQWRLIKSIELLAKKKPYCDVAQQLGFASDSAFLSFFKKMTGKTPRSYMNN